jgi:hypothetical protein
MNGSKTLVKNGVILEPGLKTASVTDWKTIESRTKKVGSAALRKSKSEKAAEKKVS